VGASLPGLQSKDSLAQIPFATATAKSFTTRGVSDRRRGSDINVATLNERHL